MTEHRSFPTLLIVALSGCTLTTLAMARTPAATGPSITTAAIASVTCTHYVAPGGSDSAPGNEAQPWATFQHAADTAQPGDTVCFRGGTYSTDETHLARSGKAGAPITFIASPGEMPILDGGGSTAELLILDPGTSYLRISGFTLRNFRIWGIELSGENRHIHLDHLDIGGGEASIRFTCCQAEQPPQDGPVEYIVLEDSAIHGSEYSAVDCCPGPCNHMVFRRLEIYDTGLVGEAFFGSDGLELARGHDILVEDCYVHDNGGDGIDLNSRDRAGNVPGIVVRRNRVVRNHLQGIKLWAGGQMVNNAVWGQGINPVVVGIYTGTYTVTNNTIAYNMWDLTYSERDYAFIAAYPEIGFSPPVTLTMVNNVFAFNADLTDGGPTGLYLGAGVNLVREDHNLYWSREDGEITAEFVSGHDPDFTRAEIADGTWTTFTSQGQGDVTDDPLFVSGWSGVNLHLQEGSPAVDAGSADGGPADDVEGRPRDATPDIGAYEWREPAVWIYLPLILKGFTASTPLGLSVVNDFLYQAASDPTLSRDFTLPTPLFAPDSAWNQTATGAEVLPESDQQILVTYRVLRGDTSSLHPPGEPPPTTWPFMDVNYDEYAIPLFRMGAGQQIVLMCDYEGNPGGTNPKLPAGPDGTVTVPAPAGTVRPAGPQDTDADGHLVLYNPDTFEEYDFWQATTVRDAECESRGGGLAGNTILEAGAIDFFDVRGSGANPDTYFSARATGVPLLAGLILPEDIEHGVIEHALAFAIPGPRNTNVADPSEPFPSDYFYPASTTETDFFNTNPFALAAGQRIRLKQAIVDDEGDPIDENQLAPITRMFLTALRTYGAYLVDNAGGFTFYAEDIHTAVLHLTDDQVNALIGQSPGTPLPADKTKWQIVIEKLNEELEQIPIAYGPWTEGQDPATATIETSNFEVVEPATSIYLTATPLVRATDPGGVATYTISVGASGSSTATVNLIAASPSPNLTLQLVPTSVIPPGQATLTVTDSHTGSALLPGLWYVVPITATDGVTQTTSVRLLVGGARLYLPLVLKSY